MDQNQSNMNNLLTMCLSQKNALYAHLFGSYDQFIREMIPYLLIQENNYFYENVDREKIYLHGFKCSNVRIKPSTFDNNNEIKFPSDARKNHLNYFGSIIVDIQQFVETINNVTGDRTIKLLGEVEKETPIGNIPLMVKSKFCSTNIMKDLRGECKYDPGGYFIVNGAEKIIISCEKIVDNKILIFSKKDASYENGLQYIAQINSKSNDWADNLQILTIKYKKNGILSLNTSSQLVDVPIFILFRALGVESDQSIISHITYDLNDIRMINLIRPSVINSVDDLGNSIKTKEEAYEYLITKLKRNKRISQTDENIAKIQKKLYLDKILKNDLLPHLGEDIPKKIVFLGLMCNRLLNVILGNQELDDRDALHNKRIETPGILLGQLFRQNWKKMLNEIGKNFKKKNQSDETPIIVINQIKPSIIEQGIKTALATGVWGMNKTKKGIAQALQRLSWIQGISYLRRIMSPSMGESTAKVITIRKVNTNQTHMLCLTADAEIVLGDNSSMISISKINNGYNVMTFNPKTLCEDNSMIYNKFSRMADKLLEIKTISGRTIKATPEHPFLVYCNGIQWKNTGDITCDDKVFIRHTEKMLEYSKQDDFIIKFTDIKNADIFLAELSDLNYLSIPISPERLVILARLVGFMINNNSDTFIINDISSFLVDIKTLGFLNNLIIVNKNNEYHVQVTGSLYILLTFMKGTNIPDWIMNSNRLIKREFLSGLMSANNIEICCNSIIDIFIKFGDKRNIIYYLSNDNTLTYTSIMTNRLETLFNEFDIQTSCHSIKDATDTIVGYGLSFDHHISNLIQFTDIIGFRYKNYLKSKSALAIEYIRLIRETSENSILHRTCKYSFEEFKHIALIYNNSICVPVEAVTNVQPEIVYDFTTISNNHSFFASSFCSSNCPVETPEGANIGIVKSLAMTSTITMQNSSQYDIIKTILQPNKYIKHPYDIDPLTMKEYVKIFINGNWDSVIKLSHAKDLYVLLKNKRREGIIDKMTTILLDINSKEIRMFYDGGRLIRPLLIVEDNKLGITSEVIEDIKTEMKLNDTSKSWNKIISKHINLIEYEDIESLNHALVCDDEQKLYDNIKNSEREFKNTSVVNRHGNNKWIKYTHADFHQWTMFGIVACNIPFSNHNYSNRNIIYFSQAKQSIGLYLSSYKDRMDISQILYNPQVPLVQTQGMKYNSCLDLPNGENAIVAICSYTGFNQEDSVIFNQSAIDRGIYRADTIKKESSVIEKNPSTSQDDIFTKPDRNKVTGMKHGSYEKLNDSGYVPEETEIENEDIIIGKISPMQPTGKNNKVYKDSSKIFKSNIPGVVDRVHTGVYNAEGYEMYNMRIRLERKPVIGDKFSCYDDSHQVLTTNGWVNIKDITSNHKVATLCNNKLKYQHPIAVQSYDYSGKMYQVDGNVSLCVTPNHRMFVREDNNYNIELAENIINKSVYYKHNADNYKEDICKETFVYNNNNIITYLIIDGIAYDINDWLEIYINWVLKGYIDELRDWVWSLPKKQARVLIDGIFSDGYNTFHTKFKQLADDIMQLALHAGLYITMKNNNIIILTLHYNHENLVSNANYIDFTGKVYCCSVMGEGIIYVRRNGIPVWCGNSRHAQKASIGIIYPQKDMPFTESGIVPDLILNPHGFPTRMSVAHFIETLASKVAAETGEFVDGTPFNDYDVSQLPIALKKLGYSPYGTEVMYCGITGRKMDAEIFIGPSYNIRLKHMVQDKVHGRARGPKQSLTRQPLEGRSKDGGLKIGRYFA